MRILDEAGRVYKNVGAYSFYDPISKHTFMPGELVKIAPNEWIKSQPVLVEQVPATPAPTAAPTKGKK